VLFLKTNKNMKSIKNVIALFIMILGSQNFMAQKQTLFMEKDFEAAMQQAKSEQKPLVLVFSATWCPHCNKMKNEVYPNQDVIDFYSKSYICLSTDIDSKKGQELRQRLKNQLIVSSFPTFAFFDDQQNVTNCISGEFNVAEFIKEGTNNLSEENHFQQIKAQFESDSSNYAKCLSYALMAKRIGFNPTPIVQKYLKTVKEENYYSSENWKLIANGLTDFDAPEFIDLINNRAKFEAVSSKKRVDRKINFVINDNFNEFVTKIDTVSYNKNRKIAATLNNRAIDSLLFHQDLSLYQRTFEWRKYHKIVEENLPKFGINDGKLINSICANYYMFVTDKKMLDSAISWEKTALKLEPSLDKYVMITNLLLKNKDYNEGILYATEGKQFGESYGFNTGEIDTLLTDLKARIKK
jgi:thioredoxin-related protein